MPYRPRPSDDFGEDEPTRVDDPAAEFDSPPTMPRCQDCGRVVFFDSFTYTGSVIAAGLFSDDRCVRGENWRWCCERRDAVFHVPR